VLVISSSLPGILRWFEVVEKSEKEIPPVQFACETMESVNKELRQLINQYTLDRKRNINPFSMRLQVIFSLYCCVLVWFLVLLAQFLSVIIPYVFESVSLI